MPVWFLLMLLEYINKMNIMHNVSEQGNIIFLTCQLSFTSLQRTESMFPN